METDEEVQGVMALQAVARGGKSAYAETVGARSLTLGMRRAVGPHLHLRARLAQLRRQTLCNRLVAMVVRRRSEVVTRVLVSGGCVSQ